MSIDLFNNPSNDYINPQLSPCLEANDGYANFQFISRKQVGVTSNNDVLLSMDLSDIKHTITSWNQQTRIIEPGEVVFIQGFGKGSTKKSQTFPFISPVEYTGLNHRLLMRGTINITYFHLFKQNNINIIAVSDIYNGVDIEMAFNKIFNILGIFVMATYNDNYISFTSTKDGYIFNINNLHIETFNSMGITEHSANLLEDMSLHIPTFKYPNTAMLGYILKPEFPTTSPDNLRYMNINHVPDYLEWFELIINNNLYERRYSRIDVGLSSSINNETMGAGDYLTHINTNNLWEKVGDIKIILSAQDTNDNDKNLFSGFYVFNPHEFPIKLTYLIIT